MLTHAAVAQPRAGEPQARAPTSHGAGRSGRAQPRPHGPAACSRQPPGGLSGRARQVLYSEDGYVYLDVRPEIEVAEVGRVKNSVNIPIQNATRKYDPEQKKKVVQRTPNDGFVAAVKKRFPDTEAKLLVACSDGRKYSMDALMALDEAGYTNIAGLKVRAAPVHSRMWTLPCFKRSRCARALLGLWEWHRAACSRHASCGTTKVGGLYPGRIPWSLQSVTWVACMGPDEAGCADVAGH